MGKVTGLHRAIFVAIVFVACCIVDAERHGRSLLAPGQPFDPPVTGAFVNLGVGPVGATHTTQIPQTNSFLIIDFLNGDPHPPLNADGTKILWIYDRDTNTYTNIPTAANIVCGGWTRTADGSILMFGGHGTFYNLRNGVQDLYMFNIQTGMLEDKGGMISPRWYATALTLPDGRGYVFGGTTAVGAYSKSPGAEAYDPVTGQKQFLPVNAELMGAGIGNFYVGAFVLPTGDMLLINSNVVQIYNINTGGVRARAPALPALMGTIRWEYPYSGSYLMLSTPVGGDTFEIVIFGGNYEGANELTICSPYSLRLSVTISAAGAYTFGPWVVEQMPAPRCHFDTVLLPNGKVMLINGAEMGIGGLPDAPEYSCGNCGNEPVTEPWEYDPAAPVGKRFTRTGAFSTIPRIYHQTGLLTSEGDILLGGCTNCGNSLKSYKFPINSYSRSRYGNTEYRLEVYRPRFVFSPLRPNIVDAPDTWIYGTTNAVTFTLSAGSGPITKVVLQDTGTTTHGVTTNRKQLELRFTAEDNVLQVDAPLNGNWAAPSWYLLFIMVGDVYSTGRWVHVAAAAGQPTVPLPKAGQGVPGANENDGPGTWTCMPYTAPWTGDYTYMAVRRNMNGIDAECLSPAGMENACQGYTSLELCTAGIVGKEGYPSLTCGEEHAMAYNTPGYGEAMHWCDPAMTLLDGGVITPKDPVIVEPPQPGTGAPWTCMPYTAPWTGAYTHMAVRHSANGVDVECLAPPGNPNVCQGYTSLGLCTQGILGKEDDAFMRCGARHIAVYGTPGYGEAIHWCEQAMDFLPKEDVDAPVVVPPEDVVVPPKDVVVPPKDVMVPPEDVVTVPPTNPPKDNGGDVPPVDVPPVAPPKDTVTAAGPWTCMPFAAAWMGANTYMAVRHANFGPDVECLSPASGLTVCQTFLNQARCLAYIPGKENQAALTCGSEHLAVYGVNGYNDPDHWCDHARALVVPAPPKEAATVNTWHCLFYQARWLPNGQGYHAIRLNAANDVECMSTNAQSCVLYSTQASCERLTSTLGAETVVRPGICGAAHTALYGDSGYATPGHWCQLGRQLLG